jgi:uncharacterized protein (TIGR04255 family)
MSAIRPLFEKKVIRRITRLGLRYVSDFGEVPIFKHINATLGLQPFNNDLIASRFSTEFPLDESLYSIINLTNLYPVFSEETKRHNGGFSSTIDIDVIKFYKASEQTNFDALIGHIEYAHNEQKRLFFSLLKDEFIETLNPVY